MINHMYLSWIAKIVNMIRNGTITQSDTRNAVFEKALEMPSNVRSPNKTVVATLIKKTISKALPSISLALSLRLSFSCFLS